MKLKIYLFYTITCFLLSLNFVITKAQEGFLTGNIQFEDGEPAISAIVQIKELQKNTITNVDGQFVFNALPFGNYTLDIGSMEAEKKQVLMAVNETNVKMDVVLERSVVSLSEVVIQAKSQKISCNELYKFIIENGRKTSTVSNLVLNSEWLHKVTAYSYDYKIYVIAEIKENEFSYKTNSYIFCNVPSLNWSNFQNGSFTNSSTYGERFHKYIKEYSCNCD